MHKKLLILPVDEEQADILINFIKEQSKTSGKQYVGKPAEPLKRYLTIDELSELLSIPRNTIYAKTSRREIPFTKVGRRLLFDREEIENWLSSAQKPVL